MADTIHTVSFDVRDYECDLQGIVNNANYQHYFEHARHLFLRSQGVEFADLAARGANLVVIRVEIDYLFPLRSMDTFDVASTLDRVSRVRIACRQSITRADGRAIANAVVVIATMDASGRPCRLPAEVEAILTRLAP